MDNIYTKIHLENGFIIYVKQQVNYYYRFVLESKDEGKLSTINHRIGWCYCDINGYFGVPATYSNFYLYELVPHIYFHSFGVQERFRHQGYGRMLLKAVKTFFKLKANGEELRMSLGVSSVGEMSNEQLIKFYESEGFVELPKETSYVRMECVY